MSVCLRAVHQKKSTWMLMVDVVSLLLWLLSDVVVAGFLSFCSCRCCRCRWNPKTYVSEDVCLARYRVDACGRVDVVVFARIRRRMLSKTYAWHDFGWMFVVVLMLLWLRESEDVCFRRRMLGTISGGCF